MERLVPFTSILFQDVVSTCEMRRVWSEGNLVQKWMDVEKAITQAQAELGMIPQDAAAEICQKLSIKNLSADKIHAKKETIGHLLVSFLKAFREICGPAAEHFHLGPTTQDILDTGLTLQIKEAHYIIMRGMFELEGILCDQALKHKNTIMMGRTHKQHAVPTTFGFILATWASEMHDHIERARDAERRWLFGNLSGVVGTQNSFVELSDSNTARKLQEMVCAKLGLNVPLTDMSTRTDRFTEITANLAGLCSALGRMGLNIRNWQQTEVMEVEEPYDDKQHSSSTLPNKKNPESSEYVEGLAIVARGLALAMQDTRMPVTRDSTRIPVQFICIPSTYMLASRALRFATEIMAGLIVHEDNMLRNINHPNVLQRAAAERIMIAMYKKTGEKDKAHSLLHKCARQSQRSSLSFREILLSNKDVGKIFSSAELDKLLDLTTYTGTATRQTEETVRAIERKRK